MDTSELQQKLFQVIKTNIPANESATDEIARVLNVSVDSVYRRMRGEKTISLGGTLQTKFTLQNFFRSANESTDGRLHVPWQFFK